MHHSNSFSLNTQDSSVETIGMLLKYLLFVVFLCAFIQELKKNAHDSFSLQVKEICASVYKMALHLPSCVLQRSLDAYIIYPFLCNVGSLNNYL